MRIIPCFFVAVAGLTATDGLGQGELSKSDLDKLQGTWLTVSLVNDGKALVDEKTPPKEGPVAKVRYDGNKWTVLVGDKSVATGIIKIDASKAPKELDVLDESGLKNDKTKLAIYTVDGDTFKYCIAPAGKPRPTEFASKVGSGHSLIVSKRETSKKGSFRLQNTVDLSR